MIEFTYNGQTYFAEKLDKKLKRLKISKNDITIVREFQETSKQDKPVEFEDWLKITFWDPENNYTYITYSKEKTKIDKYEFFKSMLWNEETKTGVQGFNINNINRIQLLDGIPKYPIELDNNGKPILETKYDW